MKLFSIQHPVSQRVLRVLGLVALSGLCTWALAGPGAHGPNGEHLDAPAAAAAAPLEPRIEAHSELFELVGRLAGGELSLLIDRYLSNEPVLQAQVEVESAGVKAKARFHADHGDFVVDDPALIQRLQQGGDHALVITVLAGDEADLLEGVLHAPAGGASAGLAPRSGWLRHWPLGLLIAGLGLAGILGLVRARQGRKRAPAPDLNQGEQP